MKEWTNYPTDEDGVACLKDMRLLKTFMDEDLRPMFDLRSKIQAGTATEIEYGDLWHLFRRGDLVVRPDAKTRAYRVINVAGGREPLVNKLGPSFDEKPVALDGFVLDCISIAPDGSRYVPILAKLSIKKFFGAQPITSLSVYPMKFDPAEDDLRNQFQENRSRVLDVTRPRFCHKHVRGKTMDEPSHDLDAQVIIDMTLALHACPHWRVPPYIPLEHLFRPDRRETTEESWCRHGREGCCGSDVIHKDLDMDTDDAQIFMRRQSLSQRTEAQLSDEDLLLMRDFVHAFVLRSRQWMTISVEDLHEVEFTNNFKDLVLPENHGDTVRALVDTHERARASQSSPTASDSVGNALDLIKGKGVGLIILLHGPPGVGKTSTAECVADDTRRPLFPITCGDLGETAAEVEKSLQRNFRLAHKWGCVLLLDEADVFLAKRNRSDLRHNAVTSVFLRSLEYYAGILFLTTNRVGVIDPAFKSRIQMSLFYPKLSLAVTKELYRKFIKRTKAEQERTDTYRFEIRKNEILKFSKAHFKDLESKKMDTWNGRWATFP